MKSRETPGARELADRPEHQDASGPSGTGGATGFRIFLNYRREDASGHAGRLYDFLRHGGGEVAGFRKEQIFMDIDTIAPGVDFRRVIEDAVGSCDVFIAVIGRQWLDATDASGRRRLDKGNDFVRLEIETALARDIPVVPALVQGAQMPSAEELPETLDDFAHRNAVELSDARWAFDVGRLTAWLATVEKEKARREQAERERSEQLERERREKDRLRRERVLRVAAEQAELERREQEERERLEREAAAERAERERLAQEAAQRADQERLEREAAERVEQERQERKAAERDRARVHPAPTRPEAEGEPSVRQRGSRLAAMLARRTHAFTRPERGRVLRSKRVALAALAVVVLAAGSAAALVVLRTSTPTFPLTNDLIEYSQDRMPLELRGTSSPFNRLGLSSSAVEPGLFFTDVYISEDDWTAEAIAEFLHDQKSLSGDLQPSSQPDFSWAERPSDSADVLVKPYGPNILLVSDGWPEMQVPPRGNAFWDLDQMLSDFVASQ